MPETATKAKAEYSLEVRKRIPASREEVFDAWLNPKSVEQWMHGGPTMSCRTKIDPRIGGSFKIDMIGKCSEGAVQILGAIFNHSVEY